MRVPDVDSINARYAALTSAMGVLTRFLPLPKTRLEQPFRIQNGIEESGIPH